MRRLRATATAFIVSIGAAVGLYGAVATPAALAYPHATASPRVHCGGFNGHLTWSDNWYPLNSVHVWGQLWTTCYNSDTMLELSVPGSAWSNVPISHTTHATRWYSVGVNYNSRHSLGFITGTPSVRVCNNYGGTYHCGKASG